MQLDLSARLATHKKSRQLAAARKQLMLRMLNWSGRLDSNQRPHAPQTYNVTVRLLRCDDVNQHLRGSQLILLCAYARLELRVSIQARHSFPHIKNCRRRNEIEALRAAVLTAYCCSAYCPFLPRPWASCVSFVAVFDATFRCCPSCPGPSCHPSFYPAAPQCRPATNR